MQCTLISELSYLALAPFLLSPTTNGVVYVVVGRVMFAAGAIVLQQKRYLHFHLLGHHHEEGDKIEETAEFKEVIVLKRMMWSTLLLGLWLMLSPFVLAFLNQAVFKVLWEDLILGFGIATFSLYRLLSRRREEIAIADWIVTALGFLTLVNPFLYSYYNVTVAVWNNVIIGSVVFLLAAYQDWKDSDAPPVKQRHHRAHS